MENKFMAGCFVICLFLCANKSQEKTAEYAAKKTFMDTSLETTCPFSTTDLKGNVVISYINEKNDSVAVMCYNISQDKGHSFGDTIEIPSSKRVHPSAENTPKIVFKPNGEIIAVWGINNSNPKKKYGGLVYYAQSFDDGRSWSEAKPLVIDTTSIDQRYFDISILQNGEAGIIWLDSRTQTDKQGSTLYYAETNGKNGFQNEKPIGETTCQCCRTDLFVDGKGNIHAVYRDIIDDSIRDMVHTVSVDGGKTFFQPKRISEDNWAINGCPHTGPTMAANKDGLHFAWFTAGGEAGVYYCNSVDNGKQFSPRQLLSTDARHPQMTTLPNGTIGIVWEETVKKDSAFYSKIVLKLMKPDGQQTKLDVTADDITASYPVIISNDEKVVFIAWVQQPNNSKNNSAESKNHQAKGKKVFYRTITLE